MFSIRTRIVVASSVVFALILVALSAGILRSFENASVAALDAQMQRCATALEAELEEQISEGVYPQLHDLRSVIPPEIPRARFCMVDSLGGVTATDSLVASLPMAAWHSVRSEGLPPGILAIGTTSYRSIWVPVDVEDGDRFIMHIIAPLTDVESATGRLRTVVLLAVPLALLLLGIATSLIIRRAFAPITGIIATANRINARDLSDRIPQGRNNDELAALTRTLNAMIERLQSAFAAQKQFIADLSHEYRTPLTILRSELEFALARFDDPQARESLRLGCSEVDRLKRMTDDLLLLTRLDSTEQMLIRAPVRLDELLAESCRRLAGLAAEKAIRLNLQIEDICEIRGDEDRLQRAIANLLENALKYSPKETTVTLHLRTVAAHIEIGIADQGNGIPPDDLPFIFDRFRRGALARTEVPGAGLGLSIVRRIVELHGGRVRVESHPGQGSTFFIEFPFLTPS